MIKIIYRSLITIITLLLFTLAYLSIFGVKTNKFNTKIISQFKQVEPDLEVKLYDVSLKLNPFNLSVNAKTIGTDIVYKDKIIEIESIKSKISLTSLVKSKFAINKISISTKSLAIKDLITFVRLFNNDPKLFIANKLVKKGYVIADLTFEFDELGNVNKNFRVKGFVKDAHFSLLTKFNLSKVDFIFEIKEKDFRFNDVSFLLNKKNFLLPELVVLKKNNEYLFSGKLNNQSINFNKGEIKDIIKDELLGLDIQEVIFSSQNNFKFKIDKKFKFKNLNIQSDIELNNLNIKNSFNLKKIFPKIKKEIYFKNQKIKLNYKNKKLSIIGNGDITSAHIALSRLRESGCDGVMIGRGCLKNPWIFSQAFELWSGQAKEILSETYLPLFDYLKKEGELFHDEKLLVIQLRKLAAWYSAGLPGAAAFRRAIFTARGLTETFETIQEYYSEISPKAQVDTSHEAFLMGGHG